MWNCCRVVCPWVYFSRLARVRGATVRQPSHVPASKPPHVLHVGTFCSGRSPVSRSIRDGRGGEPFRMDLELAEYALDDLIALRSGNDPAVARSSVLERRLVDDISAIFFRAGQPGRRPRIQVSMKHAVMAGPFLRIRSGWLRRSRSSALPSVTRFGRSSPGRRCSR